MRTILHLSDLHFGRIDARLLEPLLGAAKRIQPHLVVVSGDLTQRARSGQFRTAKAFINLLPQPQIVVPGNHDVPMHNPIARFFYPLSGYRRHFTNNPEPFFQDEEIAVLGLNSSRSLTIQDGRLNAVQVERLERVFSAVPTNTTKILVCHHPFELPPGELSHKIVGGAGQVLTAMANCRADIILSGHLHTAYAKCAIIEGVETGWSVLLSQAGTATSTRLRREQASYNVLNIRPNVIKFETHRWDIDRQDFVPSPATTFNRTKAGWRT